MTMASRWRFMAGAAALCLSALVGCAGGESAEESGGGTGGRRFLSIGTAPAGGAFFVVGGALGEVLDASVDGWDVTSEATKGSQENIRRLARGQLDLALSNAAISYFATRGEGGWDRAYPVRAVMTLAPNVALFIAPKGNNLARVADLRGKRVVVGPAGAGFEFFLAPLLEAHGLSYGDFDALNATQAGAVDMLADGAAAAAFLGGAVPTASITQASSSQDIVFLEFDDAAVSDLTSRYLFFDRATIPAGTYRGQDKAFSGLNVGSMHLITSADADEELIYTAVKTIYERREDVVARHPAGRAINPKNAARNTGTPFHPGAERFYREIGIWPEAGSGS